MPEGPGGPALKGFLAKDFLLPVCWWRWRRRRWWWWWWWLLSWLSLRLLLLRLLLFLPQSRCVPAQMKFGEKVAARFGSEVDRSAAQPPHSLHTALTQPSRPSLPQRAWFPPPISLHKNRAFHDRFHPLCPRPY